MAETLAPSSSPPATGGGQHHAPADGSKRDFLKLVAGSFAAVGVGAIVWPFISSMNPAKDVLALASVDVDISHITEGQAVTVMWRGKPVFVRHRTAKEIEEAKTVDVGELRDPQTDQARVQREPWLIVVGICTHLGCVPLGQKPTDPRGEFGGWFCPCHGSAYDTSGRIRRGPAPLNLAVPEYEFRSDTQIRIG